MNNNPYPLSTIGDFVIVGIQGRTLSDYDKQVLETYRPMGILLLARNFNFGATYAAWLEEYTNLLGQIKKYTGRNKLLVTLDHEGGHVIRPPVPITRFPYPRLFRERTELAAKAIALEMRSLGVNVCWSPDTDIFSNPANTVIGNRAFGTNCEDVIKYTLEFFRVFREEGIIGCAKHFPGHGDTLADSHYEMPVIDKSLAELSARELKPFAAMIEADVPVVMSSHILFPQIDPDNPGTLSRKITYKILREDLKFGGVICSDDLHMKAIMNRFQQPGVMSTAFDAGLDMFIMARHPGETDLLPVMAKDLNDCLQNGSLPVKGVDAARQRIMKLINSAGDYHPYMLGDRELREHAELAREIAVYG